MAKYDGHVKIGTELDESGLKKGLSGLESFASKGFSVIGTAAEAAMEVAVGAVTAGMAAIGTAVGASVKIGTEFEAQMSRVEAISGATGDELIALKEKAKEMGAATMFSATESAQAMENLASAGFSAIEITDAMQGMLDLAASSGEDLASSADIAASTLRGFGLEASQATHIADVLAKNAAATNAAVADTGEAMKYIAPVAKAMGISFEECAAAIGIMADAGIKGGQAGTSLRGALSRLGKPTEDMTEVMEDLGLDFFDAEGKMKSLSEMTAMLQSKMENLTDEERNQALITLFGQESLSGMLALMQAGQPKLDALTESYRNCDGAAADMAETMQDNLQGQLDELSSSAEALGIEVYESIQEPLKDMVKFAVEAMEDLNTAFKEDGVDGLIQAGAGLVNEVLLGMTQKAPEAVDMAVDVVSVFLGELSNSLPKVASAGGKILKSLAGGVTTIIPQIAGLGYDIVVTLLEAVVDQGPEAMASGIEAVVSFMDGINEKLPELIPLGLNALLTFGSGILDNLPRLASSGGGILQTLASGIEESIPQLSDFAYDALEFLCTSITENSSEILATGAGILTSFMDGITTKLPELLPLAFGALVSFAQGIVDNLPQIADAGIRMLTSLAEGVVNSLPLLITQVPTLINSFADTVYSLLPKILEVGWNIIKSLGQGIVDNWPLIKENAGEIVQAIINVFSLANLFNLGKNLIKGLGEGVSSMAGGIKDVAKSIVEKLKHPFSGDSWAKIGSNIINGIKSGIKNAISGLKDTAVEAAKSALGALTDFLDIHSPSRLMRDVIGKNMIAGMEVGIEDETPHLEGTSVQAAKAAIGAMKTVSASNAVTAIQGRAYAVAEQATERDIDSHSRDEDTPQPEPIDYDRMGQEIARAVDGMKVEMDGKKVGKIVTPTVNEELDNIRKRKT